jgi:hypothetical protein
VVIAERTEDVEWLVGFCHGIERMASQSFIATNDDNNQGNVQAINIVTEYINICLLGNSVNCNH